MWFMFKQKERIKQYEIKRNDGGQPKWKRVEISSQAVQQQWNFPIAGIFDPEYLLPLRPQHYKLD